MLLKQTMLERKQVPNGDNNAAAFILSKRSSNYIIIGKFMLSMVLILKLLWLEEKLGNLEHLTRSIIGHNVDVQM